MHSKTDFEAFVYYYAKWEDLVVGRMLCSDAALAFVPCRVYNSRKEIVIMYRNGGGIVRILAVDYGDARTGIAVSDALGTLAGDTFVINEWSQPRVVGKIAQEAQKRGVGRIVVGHPRNMDGSVGPRAEKSEELATALREATGLEVLLWDERLTTVDAHRILSVAGVGGKKRKQTVDAVAATLILEGYLRSL